MNSTQSEGEGQYCKVERANHAAASGNSRPIVKPQTSLPLTVRVVKGDGNENQYNARESRQNSKQRQGPGPQED